MEARLEKFLVHLLVEGTVTFTIEGGYWQFATKRFSTHTLQPVLPHLRWAGMHDKYHHVFKLYSLTSPMFHELQLAIERLKGEKRRAALETLATVKVPKAKAYCLSNPGWSMEE